MEPLDNSEKKGSKADIDSGSSNKPSQNTIVINNTNTLAGINAENAYIETLHGERFVDWFPLKQMLLKKGEKPYDLISIRMKDGTEKSFMFDISAFYGKF
jgi:hypothetical protein